MNFINSDWEILIRLLIALFFGAIVGWERERVGRPAGLRTHMLVALGSAVFTLVAVLLMEESMRHSDSGLRLDATRIIQGVVGGVGFLGAGAIIQSRGKVKGLTTAAGVWVVASVGVAAGLGFYLLAGLTAGGTLLTLGAIRLMEHRIDGSPKGKDTDADNVD